MHSVRSSFIATALGLAALALSSQSVPTTINYQGRLTDNTPAQNPLSGVFPMKFDLFFLSVGGGSIWTETDSVTVTGGIFSVQLGAGTPIPANLFNGPDRYLQITLNPSGSAEVLTPRQHLSAVGYADEAQNAALAADSTSLGAVASASWQRALSPASCASGFLTGITQAGVTTCAAVTSAAITPPLSLSGSAAGPIISANNTGGGAGLSGVTAGVSDGVYGQSTGSGGNGAHGVANSGSSAYGVWGQSSSGQGVHGDGAVYGVYGTASSASATGVYAVATAGSGGTFGIYADANASPAGTGVYAIAKQTGGNFQATGAAGPGNAVIAQNAATTGFAIGVNATTGSDTGIGVYGRALNNSGVNYGVNGNTASASGFGGYFTNTGGGTALRANSVGDTDPAAYFLSSGAFTPQPALIAENTGSGNAAEFKGGVLIDGPLRIGSLGSGGAIPLCIGSSLVSTCSSSLRYKTNLKPFSGGLTLLERLKPITFDWKADLMPDVGLGAEDVAAVDPLFVTYNKQGQVEGVKYDRLTVILINSVREQQDQLKAQSAKIESLMAIVCADHPDAALCTAK